MAEKEPVVVVKKITNVAAGGHGGSWKVAFADFMTAMMAFFLVMWLISQSQAVKKNVADYFSTPSVIEYNFANYGVELTLEKLFLDLINEPLKFFQAFITPMDHTPNVMSMGSKKIVLHFLADRLGDTAQKVEVHRDEIVLEFPDTALFQKGTAIPSKQFVDIMQQVHEVTTGVEESTIYIDSKLYYQSVRDRSAPSSRKVAEQRLDLVTKRIQVGLEHESVDVFGRTNVSPYPHRLRTGEFPPGTIKIRIRQKESLDGKRKKREFKELFGKSNKEMSVYDDFVNKLTTKKKKK